MSTPRPRLQRPSYGNTTSPSLGASTAVNRKASLHALNGNSDMAASPSAKELAVGDAVNVPGDMHGTVKFIGVVEGKNGRFVGVELSRAFAGKGKNDGDVDGVSYFTTSVPGSGIFLPVHRAEKRASVGSPTTSTSGLTNGSRARPGEPKTPSLTSKFSQSVGPGARPSSPQFKPKRPSLPRPESPLRRPTPNLAPTPGRALSSSVRSHAPGGGVTSPGKPNLRASTNTRPAPAQTPRPYSRSGSRLGNHAEVDDERTPTTFHNGRTPSTSTVPSFSQPLRSPSRLGSSGGQDAEIQRLKQELTERDKRLEEQAASLAEMETSVKELSNILPVEGITPGKGGDEVTQLRQMLREKNEKIAAMTAEFDNHRADFRSTLDSLEMASTETERVYEDQKRDLLAQVADLQEMSGSKEDFEGVALQLKQLEDLVAELEEGLEESRRGEAEARGEVEFLRGEVERGRSELRREREKAAAAALKGGDGHVGSTAKELEVKDDEIRGLKAIIQGLSAGTDGATINGNGHIKNPVEVKKLQDELQDSRNENQRLEKELEQLRRDSAMTSSRGNANHSRTESERTATGPETGFLARSRANTVKHSLPEAPPLKGLNGLPKLPAVDGADNGVYCEMCRSGDHDTLDCKHLQTSDTTASEVHAANSSTLDGEPYSPGKENATGGERAKVGDADKWCALCEKDGHLAFDCPEEQY